MPHKIHIFAKQRIKFYRDILETHIVNIITSRFPLRAVCHTAAIRLQEHDIANGTNYLETLEIYLLNNRSLLLRQTSSSSTAALCLQDKVYSKYHPGPV